MSIQLRVPEIIFLPDFLTYTLKDDGDVTTYGDFTYSQPLNWQEFCKLGESTTRLGSRWPESVGFSSLYCWLEARD